MIKYIRKTLLQQTILGLLYYFLDPKPSFRYDRLIDFCKTYHIFFFQLTQKCKLLLWVTDYLYRKPYVSLAT